MTRRRFLGKTAAVLATAGASVVHAPYVIAQAKIRWRMPTTWPASLDMLQGSAQRFARLVEEMSGG
jgi:TRAP-type mannitol/chloroaromatic compound transport system substrate-binding protein